MKNILIASILTVLGIAPVFAQGNHVCATDQYNEELIQQDHTMALRYRSYLEELTELAERPADDVLSKKKAVRTIPVVFHIIHQYGDENISKEQILDQLRVLNEDFSRLNADTSNTRSQFKGRSVDSEVEFKLARIDPGGKCTDGITRTYSPLTDGGDDLVKNLIRWDTRKYLNIWVIKRIYYGGSDGTTLGYATFPYNINTSTDGIVMRSDRVGTIGTAVQNGAGRTLTHEVGHYLGLYHPFQNGCGSSCSSSGDRICDTPPVDEPSYGCPLGNNTCHNDIPDEPDMIENFMDYANGNCMNAFTAGQKTVMTFALNNYRSLLWSSTNLVNTGVNTNPLCAPIAEFKIKDNVKRVCTGKPVYMEDLSWNGEVTDYKWTFENGSPQVSTFSSPVVTYTVPGRYKISLTVSNATGSDSIAKEEYIVVVPATAELATPYAEDFENKTEFGKDWITEESTFGWRHSTVAYDGTGSLQAYINNQTPDGQDFYIELPPIDMSVFTGLDPSFSFRVAYALPVDGVNGEYLYLEGSTDCGATWKNVYVWLGRTTLKSTNTAQQNWTPSGKNDWHVLSVKMNKNGFESSNNLFLRFRVRSASGNSVFIDDVLIDRYGLSTADPDDPQNMASVYPNPSNGTILISEGAESGLETIEIMDQTGRIVRSIRLENASSGVTEITHIESGVYFIRLTDGEGLTQIHKIIVTNTQ